MDPETLPPDPLPQSENLAKIPPVLSSTAPRRERLASIQLPGTVRFGSAPTEPIRRLETGITALDAALGGGLPRGRVSELCGPFSSGKTSLALSLLAAATQRGEVVACVDPADALNPESIGRAGAVLERLLWVRPRSIVEALRGTELLLQASGFAVIVFDLGMRLPRSLGGHVWPRLARAAERSHTSLVILAPQRVTGSVATLSLGVRARAPLWRRDVWSLFEGIETVVVIERNKLGAPGSRVVVSLVEGVGGGPACASMACAPPSARQLR